MTNRLYLLYIFMLFLISYRKVAGLNHVTADHASLDVSASKLQVLYELVAGHLVKLILCCN
jgi:hypothetical protein